MMMRYPSAHGLAHYPAHQTVDNHGVLPSQTQPANTKVESATAVADFSDAESAAALQCQLEERDSQMDAVQVLQHPTTTALHVSLLTQLTMEWTTLQAELATALARAEDAAATAAAALTLPATVEGCCQTEAPTETCESAVQVCGAAIGRAPQTPSCSACAHTASP